MQIKNLIQKQTIRKNDQTKHWLTVFKHNKLYQIKINQEPYLLDEMDIITAPKTKNPSHDHTQFTIIHQDVNQLKNMYGKKSLLPQFIPEL